VDELRLTTSQERVAISQFQVEEGTPGTRVPVLLWRLDRLGEVEGAKQEEDDSSSHRSTSTWSLGEGIRQTTVKLMLRSTQPRVKMSNPISQLNELGPGVRVNYTFEPYKINGVEGFKCRVTLLKDRETLDCEGISTKRREAKLRAAQQMVALLKLLFPMVPLALYSQRPNLDDAYKRVDFISLTTRYQILHLTEIRSGTIYLYVNQTSKTYCVMTKQISRPEPVLEPSCPVELFNDPIRFTDWSQGPITQAQETYLSKRIEFALCS